MATKIRKLEFINRSDRFRRRVEMLVDEASISRIMRWYAAYYAGDRYTVKVDGITVRKSKNGELISRMPADTGCLRV